MNAKFKDDEIIMLHSNGINNVNVSDSLQDDLLLRNTKRDHEFYGHSKMNNELWIVYEAIKHIIYLTYTIKHS